jgi:hypothetical protein
MFISSIATQVDMYSYSVTVTFTTGEIVLAFVVDDDDAFMVDDDDDAFV